MNTRKPRDFLKELEVLSVVGLAATAIGVALGVAHLLSGNPISYEAPAAAADHPFTMVIVQIDEPSAEQRLLFGLSQAPTPLLLVAVLALLVYTLHRARRTDPFTPQTVRNLRLMGLVLLLGLSTNVVQGWALGALSATVTPDRWSATASVPLGWLFGGFVCFAIAEVVNRGRVMRDELASVI